MLPHKNELSSRCTTRHLKIVWELHKYKISDEDQRQTIKMLCCDGKLGMVPVNINNCEVPHLAKSSEITSYFEVIRNNFSLCFSVSVCLFSKITEQLQPETLFSFKCILN